MGTAILKNSENSVNQKIRKVEDQAIKIIFEDDQIVVIEKPSGVICNRAETVRSKTVQDWWDDKYRTQNSKSQILNPKQIPNQKSEIINDEEYFYERSGLVHRLDKETSGVMVLAKMPSAFVELLRQFREREVEKTYLALTHGIWKAKEGEISLPIGRRRDNRQKMGVVADGRESITQYKVIAEYQKGVFAKELKVEERGYDGFSLVEFYPKTGRMHQIRVHARHLGHPIVGDEQYAGRKRSREDRKWAGRVMLHAMSLQLIHPVTKTKMKWESQGEIGEIVGKYLSEVCIAVNQ